jgi:hypothetical protein
MSDASSTDSQERGRVVKENYDKFRLEKDFTLDFKKDVKKKPLKRKYPLRLLSSKKIMELESIFGYCASLANI